MPFVHLVLGFGNHVVDTSCSGASGDVEAEVRADSVVARQQVVKRSRANRAGIRWPESLLWRPNVPGQPVQQTQSRLSHYSVECGGLGRRGHAHHGVPPLSSTNAFPYPEAIDVRQCRAQIGVGDHDILSDASLSENRLSPAESPVPPRGSDRRDETLRSSAMNPPFHEACRFADAVAPGEAPLQVQVEPRILFGIEPRLGRREHQW